ncbi:MAG: hypothetical protein AAFR47_17270 [Pseudomonadota bacterium]
MALGAVALLAACEPSDLPSALVPGRSSVYEAAVQFAELRNPVVPPEPIATCVVNNATRDERSAIAQGGNVTPILEGILAREATQACLDAGGVPDFG